MDMESMQAGFATQDQAESVIKKLASLRGDRFRLERTRAALSDTRTEFAEESGLAASTQAPLEFTFSANVPGDAAEQARAVIAEAGGRMLEP
ncbi:hypothetical protein D7Z26_08255 [Cohnella endophytica]|uniref:Uncharacterized protein n=1 Tax=Cohnella endophytica TaxID=2419778 RepID=A0A494XZ18_9BACL|nr:hypothetical protein [Cohnella endophytica]RKP55199.1 hypothetical protein D7Z26_08255 [Cohnella endophytica]